MPSGKFSFKYLLVGLGNDKFFRGPTLRIEDTGGAADNIHFGMLEQDSELPFETQGMAEVVGVHAGEELAAGVPGNLIESGGELTIFSVRRQETDPRVVDGLGELQAVVVGTVVHEKEFPVGVRLGEDGPDGVQ